MAESVTVNSWEDFQGYVSKLRLEHSHNEEMCGELLFRGQGDSKWLLQTTLERATVENLRFMDYYRRVFTARTTIESLTPNKWDLPPLFDVSELAKQFEFLDTNQLLQTKIYSYFAYLRHHGFPSPLLDWTKSPYIACYFAYARAVPKSQCVSIYILAQAKTGYGSSGEPYLKKFGHNVATHKRHFLQQCEYTACGTYRDGTWWLSPHESAVSASDTLAFGKSEMPVNFKVCKVDLPGSEQKKVLKALNEMNVNAFSLFGSEESLMETLALKHFYIE